MLVLAPDPRLGIAPHRVARVRALLDDVTGRGAGVPGIVVALPGGPDGVLDAVVLRPDGVIGLAPLAADARESVVAGGRSALSSTSSAPADPRASSDLPSFSDLTTSEVEAELDRLLALPDPPCPAPRRVLGTAGVTEDAGRSTGGGDGTLAAPVGSFRVLDADDLRRLLAAFRLLEHLPSPDELAAAGFLDASTPATQAGAAPPSSDPTPSSPAPPSSPSHPSAPRVPWRDPGAPSRSSAPELAVPRTAPVPVATRSDPGRAGPGWPAAASSLGSGPGRPPSAPRGPRGRARTRGALPAWVWGWRGLTLAAVASFGLALVLALLVGRATTGSDAPDPSATRVVDGVTFTRQVATTEVSCEGHAYGQAAVFLRERGCLHLDRALWSGSVGGQEVVVAVATVQMPDTSTAGALRSLVDTEGTGNISDLLREGRGYPGSPAALSGAGYASAQLGDRVVVAEADGTDPAYTDGDALDRISRAGLALR